MSDLHDDIRSAVESGKTTTATNGATPPPASDDSFISPPSEVLPPVMPDDKTTGKPVKEGRNPDGTFAPKPKDETKPPIPGSKEGQIPLPLGTPPLIPGQPEEKPFDPAKPPSAWTPEMKAKWQALPEDVRTEITRREEATAKGVQKLMQQYEPMEEIFNVIAPYEQYFEHIKEDPRDYLSSMIVTEQTLRLGNPAQKIELLLSLADTYGVPLRATLDTAMNGKLGELMAQAHQHHKTPPVVPIHIQRELQQARQFRDQIEDQAAELELQHFTTTPGHEYVEHVREDMANLIEAGYAEDFQSAYELALWRNPQLRPVYIQMMQNAQQNTPPNAIQQRQAAAGAIATPNQAPLVTGGEESKEGDDLYDSVRQAWNQAARSGV
jgi:hypothetical protein